MHLCMLLIITNKSEPIRRLRSHMSISNRYSYLILFLLASVSVSGQTSERDSLPVKKMSLTLAVLYSSDANYYGQTTSGRLPYLLTYAGIKLPAGFFLSSTAYKLINTGSGISGIDLTAGYDFKLSKNLSSGISYTRSFYPDSSLLLQATNLNTFSGLINYDWTWLTTGINADYIPGEEGGLFLTLNSTKSIEITSFSPKDYISFDPAFAVVGSTQRISTTQQLPSSTPDGKGRKIERLPSKRNNQTPEYKTIEKTNFNLLSYSLKLPLAYNRANYSLEASYQATLTSNYVESMSKEPRSFFSLGFYYVFP